jgi:hypothetical protein
MGEYDQFPTEYPDIFDMKSSDMAYEEDVETTGFGLARVKAEGAAVEYDTHSQGFTKRYTHVAYALGYIVTREELDDNQYKSRSFKRGKALSFSFRTTKEIVGANVLNRGFTSAYAGGDGKELFATDHPTLAGNQSNELAIPADLSEAALEDLIIQIMQAKNSRGLQIAIRPRCLIVPPALSFTAERILKSTLQNDTADNAINAVRSMGVMPEGAKVNHYLSSDSAWFIKTNAPDGLMGFQRKAFEFTQDNDFDTMNAKAKGYERYTFGWTDFRGAYGSAGA